MGQAIKLVNSNFINRYIGIVHICKYDISYCTLYKYLIGDSNSWIDLGFKSSKYNIKKVKATIVTDSSTWRFIIGNTRYISSSSQSQDAIRINNKIYSYTDHYHGSRNFIRLMTVRRILYKLHCLLNE